MRHTTSISLLATCSTLFVFTLYADGALAGKAKESVLYRFQGGKDGAIPMASMIADSAGNLYGTTSMGGGSAQCGGGCGTVFELSPSTEPGRVWTESVLYRFQGGNDGATPEAPLIADQSGNLYGVTSAGGGNCNNPDMTSCGAVFELEHPKRDGGAWTEIGLYSFLGNPSGRGNGDLAWPNGLVFDQTGNLYGLAYSGGHCTTDQTGTYCYGGAFALKPQNGAWSESVIYRFKGQSGDPAGPALDSAGNLYGTAPGGAYGCGGVFSLTPRGKRGEWIETSLYDFQCGSDGAFPVPGLTFDDAGNLFDMSLGAYSQPGSVFELSPAKGGGWTESVLYRFAKLAHGYTPTVGPITGPGGRLYGTTQEGGKSDSGIVFRLTPRKNGKTWSEQVLHSFAGGSDGIAPFGGLVLGRNSAIYGTTPVGGSGYGTAFQVVP